MLPKQACVQLMPLPLLRPGKGGAPSLRVASGHCPPPYPLPSLHLALTPSSSQGPALPYLSCSPVCRQEYQANELGHRGHWLVVYLAEQSQGTQGVLTGHPKPPPSIKRQHKDTKPRNSYFHLPVYRQPLR